MSRVIEGLEEFRDYRNTLEHQKVGLVPTMGALHHGHESLLRRSVAENDHTILSIFVNPTQFDRGDDLQQYPSSFEADRETAREHGVDVILYPRFEEMYPDQYAYRVSESELSRTLCGASREGHFDGVLTVVLKLFNLARPHRAYFGEKDFQQLTLVRGMVDSFFLPIEIVGCPTIRDSDGLASSSRNLNLSRSQRRIARLFPELLRSSTTAEAAALALVESGFEVDYVEDLASRRYGAVFLGDVRLIDNFNLEQSEDNR